MQVNCEIYVTAKKMTNDKFPMTNQIQNPNDKKNYNLTERTSNFGVEIIILKKILV